MSYQGSCHCGKIAYEVDGTIEKVFECNCSLCSRRGYLLWFLPRSKVSLKTPESALSTYTFNTHKIKHHFCDQCGCAPFGFGTDKEGNETAAINVRCLEGIEPGKLTIVPVDGRSH